MRDAPEKCETATGREDARRAAFTLVELLVVLVIGLTILGMLGVLWKNIDTRNKCSAAQTQLAQIQAALQDHRNEQGAFPGGLDAISNRLPRAFTRFEDGIPLDPWRQRYQYSTNQATYTLFSFGPDGAGASPENYITAGSL